MKRFSSLLVVGLVGMVVALPPPALAQYIGGIPPVGTTTLNFSVPGVAHAAGLTMLRLVSDPTPSAYAYAVS
jgi:hypothetical protein